MKKNKEVISTPHDQFFKTAMKDKRVAREFLKRHLPNALAHQIDFESIQLQPGSFINDIRKTTAVDVLFKTRMQQQDILIYVLVEHQSSPDKLMPFRILKYTCNIIDEHLKQHKTKKLPFIYPMVIYHGKAAYRYSSDINHLVDAPSALVDAYFLKPFQLIDLAQIADGEMRAHAWSGVMEFALKHIFARDVLPHIQNIADLLADLAEADGRAYVEIVLQYFLSSGELRHREQFFELINENISNQVGEDIMTLAEQLKAEGRLEGELKGKLEGMREGKLEGVREGELRGKLEVAQQLLDEGADIAFVARMTKLPLFKIKALKQ